MQKNKKDVTGLIMFGGIAISYGFGVYYFLPLSLVSFNFSMAMSIFLFILFGMIFALAILVINFMPYINTFVAHLFLFFEKKSVKLVVLKNLIAHKDRNRMTSIMFSLTLGFIIFLSIVCRIPFEKDLSDLQRAIGVHSINIGRHNLPMTQVDTFLRKYDYAIEEFGAFTGLMDNKDGDVFFQQRKDMWFENYVDKVEISDLSRRKRDRIGVIGLSPNLPNAVESQFIQVGDTADIVNHYPEEKWIYDEGGLSLGEFLYSAEGY